MTRKRRSRSQPAIRRKLRGAFREVLLALIGLFDLHEVPEDLEADAASVLGQVLRRQLNRTDPPRCAMRRLADEMAEEEE